MFKMFRKNYRRAVAYLLTAAMVFTNLSWNTGAAFAAGESEGALFVVDGQALKQAIDSTAMGGEEFGFSSLELIAEKKSIRNKYKAALGVGNVYELEVGVDGKYAPEDTSMRVFYSAAARKVIFLFLNESERVVSFRVNIDGYESAEVEVRPNAERMTDEADRIFAENYEAGDMVDDEVKKPSAEVVAPAEDAEAMEGTLEAGEETDGEAPSTGEETSAAGGESREESTGSREETPAETETIETETMETETTEAETPGAESTDGEKQEEGTTQEAADVESEAKAMAETEAEEEEGVALRGSEEVPGEEVAGISRHVAALVATANELPEEGLTAPENIESEEAGDLEIPEGKHESEGIPEGDKSEEADVTEATVPVEAAAPTETAEPDFGAGEAEGTTEPVETEEEAEATKESDGSSAAEEEESESSSAAEEEESGSSAAGEEGSESSSAAGESGTTEDGSPEETVPSEEEAGQLLEGEDLEILGVLEGKDLPTVTVLEHVNARAIQVDADDIFEIVANADEERFAEYDFVLPLFMPDPEDEESGEFVPFALPLGAQMLELKGVAPETEGTWSSSDPEILSIDETGFVETHTQGETEISFTYGAFADEADSADAEGAEGEDGSEVTLVWKVLVYDEQYDVMAASGNIFTANFPRAAWLTGLSDREKNKVKMNWSVPDGVLNLMNGWKKSSQSSYTGTTLHAIGGFGGRIAYCIEPDITISSSESGQPGYDSHQESSYFGEGGKLSDSQKVLISRIIDNGYRGRMPTSKTESEAADAVCHAIATQLLIWEVVVGERDGQFEFVPERSRHDKVIQTIRETHPYRDKIMGYYDKIEKAVKTRSKLPEFTGSAVLKWNGTRYEARLTDKNNVISSYNVSATSGNGIGTEVVGNELIVWTANRQQPSPITIKAEKNDGSKRHTLIVYADEWYGPNEGGANRQDVVSFDEENAVVDDIKQIIQNFTIDPVIAVKVKIRKVDRDNHETGLAGAKFRLDPGGKVYETGKDGIVETELLRPGNYTLTEIETPNGYILPDGEGVKTHFTIGEQNNVIQGSDSLDDKTITIENVHKIKLTVVKTDKYGTSTKPLAGAVFRLVSADGAYQTTATTGESGTIEIENLDKGAYLLKEIQAPEGYMVPKDGEAEASFVVSDNGTVNLTAGNFEFVNQEGPILTFKNIHKVDVDIQKIDADSNEVKTALAGAKFELRKVGSTVVLGSYETEGENGRITIPVLERGDYTLTETEPPDGYCLPVEASARTIAFRVNDNRTVVLLSGLPEAQGNANISQATEKADKAEAVNATITIENTRAVDLRIVKTVNEKDIEKSEINKKETFDIEVKIGSEADKVVKDIAPEEPKTSIYQGDGIYKYRLHRSIVDENGKIITDNSVTIMGIPTGKEYTITEILTDVEDAEGNRLDVIETDKPSENTNFDKGNLDGQKKEIKGVLTDRVEAEDEVINRIETVTIKNDYFHSKTRDIKATKLWKDEAGEELEENLRPAAIKVQLMYAKAEKDSGGSLRYGEPKVYDLSYVEDGTVKNDYTAEATLAASDNPEEDWTVTFKNLPIYDWDGNEYQYSIVETEIIPNEKWEELGWSAEGTPAPAQIENTNIFRVFGVDKVMKQNAETNEWEETGSYEVRGVFAAASDGRTLPADEEGEKLEEPALYPITNTWIPAEKLGTGFTIKKIDSETGKPLENAVFAMKSDQDPEAVFEVTTNGEGFATFPELPVGRYVLWEKAAPEGYLPIPEEMKLIVNIRKDLVDVFSEDDGQKAWKNRYQWSNEVIHAADVMKDLTNGLNDLDLGGILTVANDPVKGRLSLSKHIRLNGSIEKWLNEFSFGIYDSDGNLVDTIVVKANDEVKTSKELRYGKYTVAEIGDGNVIGGYTWLGAVFELKDGDSKVEVNLDTARFQFEIKEDGEIVRVEAANDYVRQPGGGGGGGGGGSSRRSGGGGGTTVITDPAVPLANLPEELVTLPEEDVPLAGLLPRTGDARNRTMWLLLFGGAGIGMLLAAVGLRKKKEEE